MTARNPGFTPAQRETTMQSLRDVKAHLEGRRGVEVIWRTRDEVAQALGVDNRLGDASSPDLARLLGSVDAVISTMSTAVLEAMLLKRPVAALDYHNVPRFVATAWTIAAKEHIPAVVDELLQPAPRKLAFQQDVLHDALSCRTPAAPRVADLMVRMARHAADVRRGQAAWPLPAGLIGGRSAAAASPFSLADLYPGHPFFSDTQITSLQARLARLQRRNEQLEQAARRRGLRHGTYLVGKYIAGYFRSRTPQAGA
jgi:hypothetical protein